jgi:hypothetical protein
MSIVAPVSSAESGSPQQRPAPVIRPRSGWRGLARSVPDRLKFPLTLFAVLQVILLGWWLAFFPGLGNYDSVQYSWEVLTSHWSTDHSVLYDVMVWISFQVTGGVALLTALQTTALAAVLAFTAHSLVGLGVRRRYAAAAAVACVVTPSLGSFAVYVWKDVAFAAAEIWVMACTLQVIRSRQLLGDGWAATRGVRRQFVWLSAALLAVALFRNNGFLVVLVDGVVLTAVLAGGRRLVAAASVGVVAVVLALSYGLFPVVGVQRAPADLVLGPAYDDIAVVYHSEPASFNRGQLRLMKKVATKRIWDGAGQYCWNADRLTLAYHWRQQAAADHAGSLFKLWLAMVKHHPVKVLSARLCRGTIAWSPWPGPGTRGSSIFPDLDVPANLFGWWPTRLAAHPEIHDAFQPDPPVPALRSAATSYVRTSTGVGGEWILWRGATWCYLAYIAVGLLAWRRRQWVWVAVAGAAFANQLTVLVDNPAQLIRYMEGCIYLGVLALPLLTLARRPAGETNCTDEMATAAPAVGRSASAAPRWSLRRSRGSSRHASGARRRSRS